MSRSGGTLAQACLVACLLAVTLAGCGRKGPLEPPPSAPLARAPTAADAARQERVLQDTDTPGLIQSPNQVYEEPAIAKLNAARSGPAPRPINAPPVDRPNTSFLDPLVK